MGRKRKNCQNPFQPIIRQKKKKSNIAFFSEFPLVQKFTPVKILSKIQSNISPLNYKLFFKNGLVDFLQMFPRFLRTHFYLHYLHNVLTSILYPFSAVPDPSRTFLTVNSEQWTVGMNCLRNYTIWVYVAKLLNIAIFYRILPRLMKWYRKIPMGYERFFKCL